LRELLFRRRLDVELAGDFGGDEVVAHDADLDVDLLEPRWWRRRRSVLRVVRHRHRLRGWADGRLTEPIVVVPGSVCACHDATAFHQRFRSGSPWAGPQLDMSALAVTAVNVVLWSLAMIAARPAARLFARLLL
jgi:hypothetical protein